MSDAPVVPSTLPSCPVCHLDGGFHGTACASYSIASKETRLPGREAFEAWLAEQAEQHACVLPPGAAPTPTIYENAVRIQVSMFPMENRAASRLSLWVVHRGVHEGEQVYAVTSWDGEVMDAMGVFEEEALPSNRTDEFKARTRFPIERALELARANVTKVSVNGITVDQASGFSWL